ncbi:MAG: outer membrane beta-barrel protein [Tahibacter sp.]
MRKFLLIHGVAAALLATGAHAGDAGLYLGFGAGQSNFSGDIASQINDAYGPTSGFLLDNASLRDDSDTAYKISLGYRFSPWISVEVNWANLGEATSHYETRSATAGTTLPVLIDGRYRLRSLSASLVGELPFNDVLTGSLRLGLAGTRLKYDEGGSVTASIPHTFSAKSDNTTRPIAGLGLAWSITPTLDLRADWDRYFRVGERFAFDNDTNGRFDHVDMYSLNLLYHFSN